MMSLSWGSLLLEYSTFCHQTNLKVVVYFFYFHYNNITVISKKDDVQWEKTPKITKICQPNHEEICRICYAPSSELDPLVTPCQCQGSLKYVHLGCLREWIRNRGVSQSTAFGKSYFWKNLECELCHGRLQGTYFYFRLPKIKNHYNLMDIDYYFIHRNICFGK